MSAPPIESTKHVPAPWALTGNGLIMPFLLKKTFRQQHYPAWHGALAIMMFVNYHSSPVGPYREWMLIPGKVDNPRGRHFSIGQIRVDSEQSVIGGQNNWGIPKALADFTFEQSTSDWHLRMQQDRSLVQVQGRLRGPSLPIHSALMPFSLYQQRDNTHFWTQPKAKGWGRWMQLKNLDVKGEHFPDLAEQTCLGAFAITQFNMAFPVAKTLPACGISTGSSL